jgi:hypothetical protein
LPLEALTASVAVTEPLETCVNGRMLISSSSGSPIPMQAASAAEAKKTKARERPTRIMKGTSLLSEIS